MKIFDTLEGFGIVIWNSKNRCATRFKYRYHWTDHYENALEECIASVFDVNVEDITVINRSNKKTVVVYHTFTDENEVYDKSKQVGTLLALMVTKRNNVVDFAPW